MKKSYISIFAAFLVGGLLATGVAARDKEEKQPHMQEALKGLAHVQIELQKATDDKGGHRHNALDLVKQAMDEVKAGITFDSEHDNDKKDNDKKDNKDNDKKDDDKKDNDKKPK